MNYRQACVVRITFGIISLVNIYGAIPGLYYAPFRGIGPEWVAVYEENGDVRNPPVKVIKIDTHGNFLETGKEVQVTIRNTYLDSRVNLIARTTLVVLVLGAISFLAAQKTA